MTRQKNNNTHCHLLADEKISKTDLLDSLDVVEVIEQDSHFTRKILRCKECGQLFLYQFYEQVDWEGGNDPQYYLWIPVKNIPQAKKLNKKSALELRTLPGIRIDFSKEMTRPTEPYLFPKDKTKQDNNK